MEVAEQTFIFPIIIFGDKGDVFTFTANVWSAEDPHEFNAETLMFPLEIPAVVVIEFVEDAPVQDPGKFHEYDVAPNTGVTL